MDLTNSRAISGLVTTATPQGDNVSGDVKLGKDSAQTTLSSATKMVAFDAIMQGASSDLVMDMSDLDSTGTTAWSAGTAQVETATIVGTITTAGNMTVTVTSADVAGSPLAISVAVADSDTASQVATKVRTALTANTAISAYFTAGGSSADVTLTHKGTVQQTIQGTSTPAYPANDATLNIAYTNDTCAGLTPDATSTDTTAGVASSGVHVPALNGNDFEGIATGGATALYGVYIKNSTPAGGDGITITQSAGLADLLIPAQGVFHIADASGGLDIDDITIEPENSGPCIVEGVIAAS